MRKESEQTQMNGAEESGLEKMDWLLMEYPELCKSYLGLRDFRAKLLGFLPLVSSGVFLLLASADETKMDPFYLFPVGLYGLSITVGLYIYERSLMLQLIELNERGKLLEEKAQVGRGQFSIRKDATVFGRFVASNAAKVIYGATAIGWVVLSLTGLLAK